MTPLSYSVTACDQKVKDVHGQVQFNINCNSLKGFITSPSINYVSIDSFKILDNASTPFQLKLKKAIYIKLEKPSLNTQVKHVNLKLSL